MVLRTPFDPILGSLVPLVRYLVRLTLQGGDSSPVSALRRAPLVVVEASAPFAFPWGKVAAVG